MEYLSYIIYMAWLSGVTGDVTRDHINELRQIAPNMLLEVN